MGASEFLKDVSGKQRVAGANIAPHAPLGERQRHPPVLLARLLGGLELQQRAVALVGEHVEQAV